MIVYLTGYMGSGKSRYGKAAAGILGFDFLDLDSLIQEQAGMSIPDIFSLHGEEHFRRIEQELLTSLLPDADTIISTGGGTACSHENITFMNSHGYTIYIRLHPKSLGSRLKSMAASRPMLSPHLSDLESFVERHLAERESFYLKSKLVIKGEGLTGKKLAEVIAKLS